MDPPRERSDALPMERFLKRWCLFSVWVREIDDTILTVLASAA